MLIVLLVLYFLELIMVKMIKGNQKLLTEVPFQKIFLSSCLLFYFLAFCLFCNSASSFLFSVLFVSYFFSIKLIIGLFSWVCAFMLLVEFQIISSKICKVRSVFLSKNVRMVKKYLLISFCKNVCFLILFI